MWLFSTKEKKPQEKGKWDLTIEEAIAKYGSAGKVLDAISADFPGPIKVFDPFVGLMMMERREKLQRKKRK